MWKLKINLLDSRLLKFWVFFVGVGVRVCVVTATAVVSPSKMARVWTRLHEGALAASH